MTEIIEELELQSEINIRAETQENLEKQALEVLEAFGKINGDDSSEDGEIKEEEKVEVFERIKSSKSKDEKLRGFVKKLDSMPLDIESFIRRQEELKKYKMENTWNNGKKKIISVQKSRKGIKRKKETQNVRNFKLVSLDNQMEEENSVTWSFKKQRIESEDGAKIERIEENEEIQELEKSGSEYFPSDDDYLNSDEEFIKEKQINKSNKKAMIIKKNEGERIIDDGNLKCYKERIEKFEKFNRINEYDTIEIDKDLKIPLQYWNRLYGYQQEGVKWMWDLHCKVTGGLLADEMGLGKTVQVITFFHALNHSKIKSKYGKFMGLGPSLIICPATVIYQWVQHFHLWAPRFRVAVLHKSGTHRGKIWDFLRDLVKANGIIITSYAGFLKYKKDIEGYKWHYIVLDEGHKIKNGEAKVTIAAKEFKTPYRLLLTGSPMQNNLQELWSVFDFISPGLLGTSDVFQEHFANPIIQGGYVNASSEQEATALAMASALKKIIEPFMLRRMKSDVQHLIFLPEKTEQVLFCSLSREQIDLYKEYLYSEQTSIILGREGKYLSQGQMRANILVAITALRKICNHPDLYLSEMEGSAFEQGFGDEYGCYKRSGKMIVVSALLKIWKKRRHRVLLFCQSRGMISIFEKFLLQQKFSYLKMDGSTSVHSRQSLIDKFNSNDGIDVFLLTTKTGGLGVNLIGADRVIIYDPDWNPATDTQARERAWRIGQERQVTIYRLLSAGTIEEKIYQRQVYKQLLSNKVLVDPKTQKFFRSSDLQDLFSLQEQTESTDTANIFKNSTIKIEKKSKKEKLDAIAKEITKKKMEQMKKLAKEISAKIGSESCFKEKKWKTCTEVSLEEEKKMKEKAKLLVKKMNPIELREYNRKKTSKKCCEEGNKIDDLETCVSFGSALELSGATAKFYNKIKNGGMMQEKKKSMKNVELTGRKLTKENLMENESVGHISIDLINNNSQEEESVENILKEELSIKEKSTEEESKENLSKETLSEKEIAEGNLIDKYSMQENLVKKLLKEDLTKEYLTKEELPLMSNSRKIELMKSNSLEESKEYNSTKLSDKVVQESLIQNNSKDDDSKGNILINVNLKEKATKQPKKNFDIKLRSENKKRSKNKKEKHKIDYSGEIDGEKVEGLIRCEVKKLAKKEVEVSRENEDQFVLEKLFSKKGLHSALQHDVIVQGDQKERSVIAEYEAEIRANLAIEALKKSRSKLYRQ